MLSRLICALWGHHYHGVILSSHTLGNKTVTKILCHRCTRPVTIVYFKNESHD